MPRLAPRAARVLVRNASAAITHELSGYTSLTYTKRHGALGVWTMRLPVGHRHVTTLQVGAGIVVELDGITDFSGIVTGRSLLKGDAAWEIRGADDLQVLADRVVLPAPLASTVVGQTAVYDQLTAKAETLMRWYVDRNAGPSAIARRRVAGLTLAPDQARGLLLTAAGRFDGLLAFISDIAVAGATKSTGDGPDPRAQLGMRVVQTSDTTRQFQLYQPVDRSASVVFSEGLGNLADYELEVNRPEATYGYAVSGQKPAYTYAEHGIDTLTTNFGIVETATHANETTDAVKVSQELDKALTDKADTVRVKASLTDTDGVRYGAHYQLGDVVAVELTDTDRIENLVREVTVTIGQRSITVAPTFGSDNYVPLTAAWKRIVRLSKSLSAVQRAL